MEVSPDHRRFATPVGRGPPLGALRPMTATLGRNSYRRRFLGQAVTTVGSQPLLPMRKRLENIKTKSLKPVF